MTEEEEALSITYFKDAAELLEKTYRRFYSGKRESLFVEDLDVLWSNVQPIDGYVFLLACKKHINDFTGDDKNAGDWFPTPANIKKHAMIIEDERIANHQKQKQEQQEERSTIFLGKDFTTVNIEDPWLQRLMGKRFVECYSNETAECQTCFDSGYVRFYYYPEKPAHLFLGKEWLDLWDRSKEQAEMFKISQAICDECKVSEDILYRQREKDIRYRQPTLSTVRKLVERRKEKHKQILRQQDLAAGDQTQLELERE
tara:strand:+ start:402 stop:1172 length:771 start_codon:yes stop_codon:yes gene_type:complete